MKAVKFTDGALKLADQIVKAVWEDEQSEGCDISAGLFGPSFSRLIADLAEVQDAYDEVQVVGNEQGYAGMSAAEVMRSMVDEIEQLRAKLLKTEGSEDDEL